MGEFEQRWPGMRNVVLAGVIMTLQGGWWLTTASLDLVPHLPIVLASAAGLLMLWHAFTARRWMLAARRPAFLRVAATAVVLLSAALVNITSDRVDVARKIVACFALAVPAIYLLLFTRFAFRIAARERAAPRA
jgi:hypothetical protein